MLIAALQHVSRGRLFVTSYMRDRKIKILCKIITLVAGLVLVSAEKSETRRFETKIKTKTRGFETKTETKKKQTGLETKTSLETSNTESNHNKVLATATLSQDLFKNTLAKLAKKLSLKVLDEKTYTPLPPICRSP